MTDLQVQIGDYGMQSLKKFCKLFHGYEMLNNWSAPEIFESQFPGSNLAQAESSAQHSSQIPPSNTMSRSDSLNQQAGRNPRYDRKASFFNKPQVDIYSLGMILWEMETGHVPFENESQSQVYSLLANDKMRPRIPPETNKSLALLIRRCWQDNSEKRPSLPKILESLKIAEFS